MQPAFTDTTANDYKFNNTENNDCTISQIFTENYNGDSFQNQDGPMDEEEMVLNDLESNENQADEEASPHGDQEVKGTSIDSIIKDIAVPDNSGPKGEHIGSDENSKLKFITSKVGHPMLVIDDYSFHKHSFNPKTGRINWRCSRRRVRDIRCPSSCYTENGVASRPTRHHDNCYSLSDPTPKPKRTLSRSQLISKTSLDGYTPLGNRTMNGENDYNNASFDNSQEFHPFGDHDDHFGKNGGDNCDYDQNEVYNDYGDVIENSGEEFLDYDESDRGDYLAYDANEVNGPDEDDDELPEYRPDDYSCEPESFSKLINDLNDMKRRERLYREKLSRAHTEIEKVKKLSMQQIQSMKWKVKIVEIDLLSLKSSLHQKNTQNSNLRKLVDEMMTKAIN